MAPSPHDRYYMKDGVLFLVENTLFRVPRYMLEQTSPMFKAMLSDVKADAPPIPLPNMTSTEFDHLLKFLYPLTPQSVYTPSTPEDEDQWIAILRVATTWEMTEIRKAAIMILSGMFKHSSPMSQISLGREHSILSWVKEGFIILCLRPSPLRADEAVQLTKDDVIAYALAREEIRRCVFEQEGKRKEERPSTSRQIAPAEENDMQHYGLMHWAHSRMVHRIVNSAFGFEEDVLSDDGSDEEDVPVLKDDTCRWRPLLSRIKSLRLPHILRLVKSHHHQDDRRDSTESIKEINEMAHVPSELSIADIDSEKQWGLGTLHECLQHLTPLSFTVVAISVLGVLILIPRTLT